MRSKSRVDRPRIIGSITERMLLHSIAYEVLIRMQELHPELEIDVEALEHIKLGFLREPCNNLLGYCSYSSKSRNRPRTQYEERHGINRILISRVHMVSDLPDAIFTIHHEFLHAILGSKEGHGPIFQKHEPRVKSVTGEILQSMNFH
ncbi:MAG: hypothetical protein CMA02_02840 [Euryarchaeota archaeon]|nr:hypothetical protein [Euryarchaeota archaeon]